MLSYNGKALFTGEEGSVAEIDQVQGVDFSSPEAVEETISAVDAALQQLDQAQVEIGSKQKNELESRKASLEVTRQNLVAAESQIRDADYGREMMGLTLETLKTKASMAMMAHSKVSASMILSLLESNQ